MDILIGIGTTLILFIAIAICFVIGKFLGELIEFVMNSCTSTLGIIITIIVCCVIALCMLV